MLFVFSLTAMISYYSSSCNLDIFKSSGS